MSYHLCVSIPIIFSLHFKSNNSWTFTATGTHTWTIQTVMWTDCHVCLGHKGFRCFWGIFFVGCSDILALVSLSSWGLVAFITLILSVGPVRVAFLLLISTISLLPVGGALLPKAECEGCRDRKWQPSGAFDHICYIGHHKPGSLLGIVWSRPCITQGVVFQCTASNNFVRSAMSSLFLDISYVYSAVDLLWRLGSRT